MVALAGYQVVRGVEGLNPFITVFATIAFGVLVIAGVVILIMGPDLLGSPWVATASSIIPLSLAAGMVNHYIPQYTRAYMAFALIGLTAIIVSRFFSGSRPVQTATLAIVHALAGGLIVVIPILLSVQGKAPPLLVLVSLGGILMGLAGMLLGLFPTGRLKISKETHYSVVMAILALSTLLFVVGSRVSH